MMWILEVSATAVEQCLCLLWGKYIFGVKKIKWKWGTVLLLFMGVTTVTLLNTLNLYSVLTMIVSIVFMFLMMWKQYDIRIWNAVSGTFGYMILLILCDYGSVLLLSIMNRNNFLQTFEFEAKARVGGIIISKLLLLFCVIFFSRRRMHLQLPEKKYWKLYCIGNIILIVIAVYLWQIMIELKGEGRIFYYIGSFLVLLTILMGIMLYQFIAITEGKQRQCELELVRQHNKYLTELFECNEEQRKEFHKLRHDMKNYMIGMQELLKQERIQEVQMMMDSWLQEMNRGKTFVKTGNQILDSILEQKSHIAEQQSVHIRIDMECQEELGISVMDLCALFGNALDNAIESARESERKNILIFMKKINHYWVIKISNSCDHRIIKTETGLATTKKSNKEEHGIGFKRIQEIVAYYEGSMEWSCEKGVFCLKMVFQEMEQEKDDRENV